jgi:23S rRNA (pseudouridine1915-N3)-methyltransferase
VKRVEVLAVGRLKEAGLRALCDHYYRRCRPTLEVVERELRDRAALQQAIPPKSTIVALDEGGEQLDSPQLAQKLQQWRTRPAVSRLVFLVGGADGLGAELRQRADFLLGLSRLTLSHRLARVVLAEQLYRAVTILGGHPYHRG